MTERVDDAAALTPVERAIVKVMVSAIVKELRAHPTQPLRQPAA